MDRKELYLACDVEADGPIPGPYSMLSIGFAAVNNPTLSFYTEIQPISDNFDPKALAVSGLDRDKLIEEAPPAHDAMRDAFNWVESLKSKYRPVFLAGPAVWDGMFVHWYFMRFVGKSPFGPTGSGIDFRSYWMGMQNCEWKKTGKRSIKKACKVKNLPHTHHAGEDARELATIFEAVLKKQEEISR